MGRYEEAIDAYQQALAVDVDDLQSMNHLGVDQHRVGQYKAALATFDAIEKVDPSFEPAYCNRIITYSELGDHEKAEEMFYLARLYREHCPHCYYNIGCSLFEQGRYDRAIYCWQQTLDLDDRHPDVRVRVAEAYWEKGELTAARQHYLAGLRQDPGDTDALLDLGELLMEMGQVDEAGEKFRRAIELAAGGARRPLLPRPLAAPGRSGRGRRRRVQPSPPTRPDLPRRAPAARRAVPADEEPGRGPPAPAGRAAAPA